MNVVADRCSIFDVSKKALSFSPALSAATFILLIFAALLEILGIASLVPVVIGMLAGEIPDVGLLGKVCNYLGLQLANGSLNFFLGFVALAIFFRSLVIFASHVLVARLSIKLERQLTYEAFISFLYAKWTFNLEYEQGKILDAVARMAAEAGLVLIFLLQCAVGLVLSGVFLITIGYLSSWILLAALIIGISIYYVMGSIVVMGHRIGADMIPLQEARYRSIVEMVQYLKYIRGNNQESYLASRFQSVQTGVMKAAQRFAVITAFSATAPETLVVIGSCILLACVGAQEQSANDSTLISLLLLYRGFHYMNHFNANRQNISRYGVSLVKLESLIASAKSAREVPLDIAEREISFNHTIEFRNVSFEYQINSPVLSNLTFTVKKGEKVVLNGRSGSGKTTAVDLLMGILRPKSGEILIDGIALEPALYRSWRSKISYIPQEVVVFNGTIRENLLIGATAVSDEQIDLTLKQSQLWDFVQSKELGLDSLVGDRGAKLSGGQRQRIAIARALIQNKPIIILDEATNALDFETNQLVYVALDNAIKQGKTVIIIRHLSSESETLANTSESFINIYES